MKNKLEDLPSTVRVSEAAKILGISPWTLRLWDNKGILKPIRMGSRGDRRYKKEDLLEILKRGTK